ncbi:TPA: transglycosylase SLT domain-containing protein [Klebsiella quasipneumoniae subsp. quasipneumoniae]|nr:transglycosylase SLT domain-containing protein [Klebsiella quasipneumoniae subsp. quasipneumoniae]
MPRLPFYDRQVTTQGLGASPVNLPATSADQQFLNAGAEMAARATEDITRTANDTAMQGASLNLDNLKYNLDKAVQEKQGLDARTAADDSLKQFDKASSELDQTIPASRREDWSLLKATTRLQLQSSTDSHALNEYRRYQQGQFEGRMNIAELDAGKYWDNPGALKISEAKTLDAIDTYADISGWSPEQTAAMKQEMQQKMAKSATLSNIASRTQSMMNTDGTLNAYDGTIDADQLTTAMIWQESKGRQLDASGQPLTSKKGAVGIAQIMRGTGPEAAEAAGLPWDEERWRNDPAYNFALGKAYLNKQLKTFGGNQVLALAAYNAGAGMVNDWINGANTTGKNKSLLKIGDPRTGAITNEDFVRSIPFSETQNYVAKIMDSVPSVPKTATMAAITDTPYFHQLSPQDQSSALSSMAEILNKQRQASRVVLDGVVNDASAALRNGQQPPVMPTRNQLISTYGLVQGGQLYTQLQNDEAFGNNVKLVKNIPPAQQQQLLNEAKPEPGPNYAERLKNYDQLQSAISTVNSARNADPVAFGMREGVISQLDISSPENFSQGIKQRMLQASQLPLNYGTPLRIFNNQEASALGKMLRDAPASQSLTYLDSMYQYLGGTPAYQAALQQISGYAPSAAVAGIIIGKSGSVVANSGWFSDTKVTPLDAAKTIIEGANARKGMSSSVNGVVNQTKGITMPKDSELRPDFDSFVGVAFAGDSNGAAQAYEVAKDYYSGIAARNGNLSGEYDKKLWEQAINIATGGIHDYNGQGQIMLPWGMSASQFDDAVNIAWKDQVLDAGVKAPPGQYGLQSHGDGQYLVKLGTGYLLKNDGTPVILNVQQPRVRFVGGIPQ